MAYLGREIWLFLTDEGRPGALYSVSGRSKDSRERKAVYYPEENRVAIEPLDKTQAVDALRHYNAMKFNYDLLVVTNGLQTEDIFNMNYSFDRGTESLRKYLNEWGPEPDSLNTPRIAGTIEKLRGYPLFYLAIISEASKSKSTRLQPRLGTAYGISTYSGKGTEPESFDTNKLSKQRMIPNVKVPGKSPEEIARFFVDKIIDPEFFVCCSAAIWNEESEEWKLFTLNKSG